MDIKDPKQIGDKLKSVYTKIGQGIVYSILQEFFYYTSIMKPKQYKKPMM